MVNANAGKDYIANEGKQAETNALTIAPLPMTEVAPMIHRRGLEIPAEVLKNPEQMLAIGKNLAHLQEGVGWMIGDYLLAWDKVQVECSYTISEEVKGKKHYKPLLNRICEHVGLESTQTAVNYKSVCAQYSYSEREQFSNVPFSHFHEIAYMPRDARLAALEAAQAKLLTKQQLRDFRNELMPKCIAPDGKEILPSASQKERFIKTMTEIVKAPITVEGKQKESQKKAIAAIVEKATGKVTSAKPVEAQGATVPPGSNVNPPTMSETEKLARVQGFLDHFSQRVQGEFRKHSLAVADYLREARKGVIEAGNVFDRVSTSALSEQGPTVLINAAIEATKIASAFTMFATEANKLAEALTSEVNAHNAHKMKASEKITEAKEARKEARRAADAS